MIHSDLTISTFVSLENKISIVDAVLSKEILKGFDFFLLQVDTTLVTLHQLVAMAAMVAMVLMVCQKLSHQSELMQPLLSMAALMHMVCVCCIYSFKLG